MVENGKGVLFKNDKKKTANQPDYTGNFILTKELLKAWEADMGDGEYKVDLASWIKEGKKGQFLSLSVSAPYKGERRAKVAPTDDSDDAPF